MVDFVDYYSEFEIERTASCEEIRNALGSLEANYLQQRAICITSDELEVVQKLLALIDKAIYHLANEDRRKKYDKQLEQMAASGNLSNQQQKAKNDYEQAVLQEKNGRLKEAIMFAERAVNRGIYNQDAYALMIRCCYKIGDYEKALRLAERKAIRIYPDELSFRQYASRIHIIHRNYDSADVHIQNMLKNHPECSKGHIEQVVRLLYMSEDNGFTQIDKEQYRRDAENTIRQYLFENADDLEYRSSVATAIIGLSEKYYSSYEDVSCKIIDSQQDYQSILALHEWANQISDDPKVQAAYAGVVEQGKRKYNNDNTKSLVFMTLYAITGVGVILSCAGYLAAGGIGEFFTTLGIAISMVIMFIAPWILLIKVSCRPLWMIDRIRYTGKVDLVERIAVAYGLLILKIVELSWEFFKWMLKFVMALSSG